MKKVLSKASRTHPEYILCQNTANTLCTKPICKAIFIFFFCFLLKFQLQGVLGYVLRHALNYEVKYQLKHMPTLSPPLLLIYRQIGYVSQLSAYTKLYIILMYVGFCLVKCWLASPLLPKHWLLGEIQDTQDYTPKQTPQKSEEKLCKEAVVVSEDKETEEWQHNRSLSFSHYHFVGSFSARRSPTAPSMMKSDVVKITPIQP